MKNKIVFITASLIAMIAMTGIAVAATGIIVDPDPITINIGETGTQIVTVSAPSAVKSLTITGEGFDVASIFTVKVDGVETTSVSGTWPSPKSFTVTLTNNKGALNGNYVINYKATYLSGTYTKTTTVQADVTAIPEFPTIALPVISALGIMLLVSRRKRRNS